MHSVTQFLRFFRLLCMLCRNECRGLCTKMPTVIILRFCQCRSSLYLVCLCRRMHMHTSACTIGWTQGLGQTGQALNYNYRTTCTLTPTSCLFVCLFMTRIHSVAWAGLQFTTDQAGLKFTASQGLRIKTCACTPSPKRHLLIEMILSCNSLWRLNLILRHVYVCLCAVICSCVQMPTEAKDSGFSGVTGIVSCLTWVLESSLQSSGRALRALDHWAIFIDSLSNHFCIVHITHFKCSIQSSLQISFKSSSLPPNGTLYISVISHCILFIIGLYLYFSQ